MLKQLRSPEGELINKHDPWCIYNDPDEFREVGKCACKNQPPAKVANLKKQIELNKSEPILVLGGCIMLVLIATCAIFVKHRIPLWLFVVVEFLCFASVLMLVSEFNNVFKRIENTELQKQILILNRV